MRCAASSRAGGADQQARAAQHQRRQRRAARRRRRGQRQRAEQQPAHRGHQQQQQHHQRRPRAPCSWREPRPGEQRVGIRGVHGIERRGAVLRRGAAQAEPPRRARHRRRAARARTASSPSARAGVARRRQQAQQRRRARRGVATPSGAGCPAAASSRASSRLRRGPSRGRLLPNRSASRARRQSRSGASASSQGQVVARMMRRSVAMSAGAMPCAAAMAAAASAERRSSSPRSACTRPSCSRSCAAMAATASAASSGVDQPEPSRRAEQPAHGARRLGLVVAVVIGGSLAGREAGAMALDRRGDGRARRDARACRHLPRRSRRANACATAAAMSGGRSRCASRAPARPPHGRTPAAPCVEREVRGRRCSSRPLRPWPSPVDVSRAILDRDGTRRLGSPSRSGAPGSGHRGLRAEPERAAHRDQHLARLVAELVVRAGHAARPPRAPCAGRRRCGSSFGRVASASSRISVTITVCSRIMRLARGRAHAREGRLRSSAARWTARGATRRTPPRACGQQDHHADHRLGVAALGDAGEGIAHLRGARWRSAGARPRPRRRCRRRSRPCAARPP